MKNDIVIREYKPEDPSLVSYLQMVLYQKQHGSVPILL